MRGKGHLRNRPLLGANLQESNCIRNDMMTQRHSCLLSDSNNSSPGLAQACAFKRTLE